MMTHYQTQYLAWQLTRRLSSDDEDKLTGAIMDAQIDLNPHQVDAALFAFKNPLAKGVLLADEVGLGKTIEAGLVIAQKWAERRRRILIIVPANLRKQWHQELQEKFGIEALIIETKNYNKLKKQGNKNPFDQGQGLFICSYHFAKAKAEDIQMIPWNLAVIDEAHRLDERCQVFLSASHMQMKDLTLFFHVCSFGHLNLASSRRFCHRAKPVLSQ